MALFVFIAVLFLPDSAWAWGPGAHISFASEILDSLSVFSPILQTLLKDFPYDFLYGNISADIIFGRKFAGYKHHCHNWAVGLQVLRDARSRPQKAFAYGYLGHLAADCIAHNYFVPYQVILAYKNRFFRHNYWEIRFDAMAEEWVWDVAKKMKNNVDRSNDILLEKTLKRVLFSFKTNRRIFSSILLIQRMRQWRRMINAHSYVSRRNLTQDDFLRYSAFSRDAMISVLRDFTHSHYFKIDPTGTGIMSAARTTSQTLRKLNRRKGVPSSLLSEILSDVERSLWL